MAADAAPGDGYPPERVLKWRFRIELLKRGSYAVIAALVMGGAYLISTQMKSLAGKATSVSLQITVGLSIVGLAAVITALAAWNSKRHRVVELEERNKQLEAQIRLMQRGGPPAPMLPPRGKGAKRNDKRKG